ALLLIEPTEQEIHLLVDILVGMVFPAKAVGALALMDFLLRHGLTLRDRRLDSMTSLPKTWNLFLDGPLRRSRRTNRKIDDKTSLTEKTVLPGPPLRLPT